MSLRHSFYTQLEPTAWPHQGLSVTNRIVCAFILVSAIVAILDTESTISVPLTSTFLIIEWIITAGFLTEYAARLWVTSENPKYSDGWAGRFRYVRSPMAIIDLLALAPSLLSLGGSEAYLLRLLRLIRILRLARLGPFSQAMAHVRKALTSRRHELVLSVCLALLLLVASSILLYLVEGRLQPDAFGSIPRAMWWSVMTLTTVGYGDVYPVTMLGRIFAAMTAISGIGLIAMPTGILAAAFSDAMRHDGSGDKE